jgi:ABC-type branched-subunit amino acid transport system ATPase component
LKSSSSTCRYLNKLYQDEAFIEFYPDICMDIRVQVISGMSSSAYWFANYLFDVLQYCISGAAVGALIWYFGGANFSGDGLYVLISVIAMYGVSVYPFVYFISLGFSSHSTGQNAIILLLIVLSIILLLVSTVLQVIPSVSGAYDQWVQYLMRIFPSFTLANTINNLTMRDTIKLSVWDWNFCVLNFLSMGAQAVGYMLLILLAEQLNDVTLCYSCRRRNAAIVDAEADQAANADIDVSNERAAIMQDMAQEKIQSRLISDKLISLRGLRRVYPNKIAVRNLWFGVSKGECFGFLGSNGAGKSTALRMLTSEELPEAGTARLANLDLLDQTAMVHRRIGYCPQYDALPELLTPTELLFMFGRLRGISEVDLPVLVDLLIARLALTDGKHKPCGKLSGGNKRKCALALALIGNPAVVFLDEPTTGMYLMLLAS